MIPFFKRGPGPLVSVLIASRGRPDLLRNAVRSCLELAKDRERVEVIVASDDDDPDTTRVAEDCLVWSVVGPRGNGYADMHKRLYRMAVRAHGDWLMVFNDDACMWTQDWDEVLSQAAITPGWYGIDDVCLLVPRTRGDDNSYAFPILRTKVVQLLGHVSPVALADTYLFHALSAAGAVGWLDIEVFHEPLLDRTARESEEHRKRLMLDVQSLDCRARVLQDAGCLLGHMWKEAAKLDWADRPQGPGWYWYREGLNAHAVQALVDDFGRVSFGDGQARDLSVVPGRWALRVAG